MILTNIRLALKSIRAAKFRSFLTMVAVIIGVGGFLVVTSTVEGLKSSASQQIDDLGGNLVTINSGKLISTDESGRETVNFAASVGQSTLTEKDLKSVQDIDGVKAAAPQILVSGQIERNNTEVKNGLIIATNEDYPEAFGQNIKSGAFFTDADKDKNFVVVGDGLVQDLFGGELILGSKIQIRGEEFTIVGAMEPFDMGALSFGLDLNKTAIISINSAKKLTGGLASIQEIDIQLADTSSADQVVTQIESKLLENHGGEEDFTVLKQDELIDLTGSLFDSIKGAAQYLSYIMLFVAAVVILLIMLITVTERTHEIGIRKSIGASNGNIMVQFITESIVLSWTGSIIGLGFGYLLGLLVKAATDITPTYTLNTLLVVVAISTVVGALAGLYPAWQAARKDPVEALRHE